MKLLLLYHPANELSNNVEDYVGRYRRMTNQPVDVVSLETPEGSSLASLYDIVEYPAVLIIRDDGQLVKFWQGSNFPVIEDVVGYLSF